MKTKNGILLLAAAALLGVSIWVLLADYPSEIPGRASLNLPEFVVRQGIGSLFALLLALGMGQFLPARQITRFWWLPLALFGFLLVAMAVSVWMGLGRVVSGTHWWQRSPGLIAIVLALISAMSFAVPRFASGKRGGIPAMAGVLLLVWALPLWLFAKLSPLLLLFTLLSLCLWSSVRGRRLWGSLAVAAILFTGTVVTTLGLHPRETKPFLHLDSHHSNFQLLKSMLSINAGGLAGGASFEPYIPEWQTDFVFGRLCGAGGLIAGLAVLLLTGLMLTLIWQITARQRAPRSRVLAAGCAAALTTQPLFHVAVNLGLCPAMPFHFPFLSYGPMLLLLDGLLLGILLSLDRESVAEEPVPAPWPTNVVIIGLWVLWLISAVRLHTLSLHSPHLTELRAEHELRVAERLTKHPKPVRGLILDVNGAVLAQPGTNFIVCADPHLLAESSQRHFLPELARLIGLDESVLLSQIADGSRRYVRLDKNIPAETVESIGRMHIPGVFIESAPSREYPAAAPVAHLVGFIRSAEELEGGGGVELMQNRNLANGLVVRLTLDIKLQAAVQQIADAAALHTRARQVQIIVMNPRTGAVRAAAQVPAAHGSSRSASAMPALWWRAVIDVFEPGGLMKPLVLASALEAGLITGGTLIDCEHGTWVYCGHPLHDAAPLGILTPNEILVRSSNIGMAKIGLLLGKQPLYDALVKWGLSEKCSVGGFGGAPVGLLHPPARWSGLEITRIPIGHSCSFSLLQILQAYTAFFNAGQMAEPFLSETGHPVNLRPVLKPETATAVRAMLANVVAQGAGHAARMDSIPIFGETAVIQKLTPDNRGYSPDKFQTAFIGGFEQDATSALILVWLDEPDRENSFNPAPELFRKVAGLLVEPENNLPARR